MTNNPLPESGRSTVALEGVAPAFGLVLAVLIALFAALSIYLQTPPAPLAESAPTASFSAGRAMKHLRVIARNPHPLGTTEHDAVRDYIIGELNALGLSTQVQRTTEITPRRSSPYRVGTIQNIIGRIPGTSNNQSVLLVGHYDSAPNSPGTSDDGSGVAALLETARALKSETPPRNDVVFLFTDGEEAGLLGAEAFVREHPAAKNVRVVFNFEARGSGGPAVMFETSDNNGWLIREFAGAAPNPVANSLSYEIYKRLPNDTDLTVFKKAGYEGLNFAYINQLNRYHTAADSIENIDERSVQAQGAYALALARHFGNLVPGQRKTGNAVYFNLLGPVLIHYPQWLVIPLAALAVLLFVGAVVLGIKRGRLNVRGIALGFIALLVCGIASWVLVTLMWRAASALHKDFDAIPWGDVYNSGLYVLAFVFLTIAIFSAFNNWFRRRTDAYNLTVGGLVWWVLLTVGTSLFVPGASYLFTWPLLFAIGALYILLTTKGARGMKTLLVLAIYTIPAIILLSPIINQIFAALTLAASGTIILFEVLLLGLLFPHFDLLARLGRWMLPGACALIAIGLILAGLLTAGSDRRRPKSDNVFYGLQADSGTAVWGSSDKKPDEWTEQFFGAGNEKDALTDLFPLNKRQFMKGAAPAVALAAPQATLLNDQPGQGGERTLQLRLTSPRRGANLAVYVEASSEVVAAAVNGKTIELSNTEGRGKSDSPWSLNYLGLPEEGAELKLTVKTNQPVKLRIDDRTYGLPQIAEKPVRGRPDYIIPSPSSLSDVTIVSKSYVF